MRIVVDADACPVEDILIRIARERQIPVIMVCDTAHELSDSYSTHITVDKARDSADICLANLLEREDLVVTQDYGVAALALGKGARALNPMGLEYTNANMDQLLFERYVGQKIRRGGGRAGKNKKRTAADDKAFERALLRAVDGKNME